MPNINKLPFGLLGFLGLKNGGRNPQELAETLAPTMDLTDLYFGTNKQLVRLSGNVTAIGFNLLGAVPNDEVWALTGCSCNSNAVLGAGVTLKGLMAYAAIDGAAYNVVALGAYANMTVGEVWYSGTTTTEHFVLGPGTQLGVYVTNIAAGPVAVAWTAHYARMQT